MITMKTRWILTILVFAMVLCSHLQVRAQDYVIDDFLTLKNWKAFSEGNVTKSVEFAISDEWASQGKTSLRIDAPKFEIGISTPWPGVVLSHGRLPLHDWQGYGYFTVDLKVIQPDTKVLFLVQSGAARHQRVSPTQTFAPGEYRIWLNIPDYIADGKPSEVSLIRSIEICVYRPEEDKTIFIDNIQLRKNYVPTQHDYHFLGIDQQSIKNVAEQLKVTPPSAPKVVLVERIDQSPLGARDFAVKQLQSVTQRAQALAKASKMQQRLAADFPDKKLGAYAVPSYERVHFYAQSPTSDWRKQAALKMGRRDKRTFQLCLVRDDKHEISGLTVKINNLAQRQGSGQFDAENIDVNTVGFINLAPNAQLPFVQSGWYADPILNWKDGTSLDGERLIQPLLLTVSTPSEQPAGQYIGQIEISYTVSGKTEQLQVPLEIEVTRFQYPQRSSLKTLIATGPYGDINPDFFLDYRISPNNNQLGSIYLRGNRPGVNLPLVEESLKKGMTTFNLHQVWELEFSRLEKEHGLKGATDIFMSRLERLYPANQWEELARKGIAQHAVVYGFDEVGLKDPIERARISAVFQAIKDKYGKYGVKVATSAQPFREEYLDLPVDIWIPSFTSHDRAVAEKARQRGQEVWVYMVPWEIWQPLAWSQAIPWAAFQLDAPGWLYYNFSGWPDANGRTLGDNPLTNWDAVSLQALGRYGTGGLVYKDADNKLLPSLRLVNFREGMLDHDLLKAIQQLAESNSPRKQAANALLKRSSSELVIDFVKDHTMEVGDANFIGDLFENWRHEALDLLNEKP